MKNFLKNLTFTFLLSIMFTGIAVAQDSNPPTDDEVNAVASKLYCPVCESTPLDVCPTEACKDWREQIRVMLSEGKTEDEILQYFEDQYGGCAEPPRRELAYLSFPPAVILAGAVVLFRSLKEWTKPKAAVPAPGAERSAASSDDYVARLEEELKKKK
jgi:cytochrome c-type biogenesis protein CcmH